MAIGSVNPGYTGYALIGSSEKVRYTDASINVRQEVNAPDLIMGHWDHNAYVYGPIEVGGSISGPVTENFVGNTSSLWTWATKRSGACGSLSFNDVSLYYYCDRLGGDGKSRTFPNMMVNSLNFSCTAGDIAQFSIDLLGAGQPVAPSWGTGTAADHKNEEKLLTWDKVGVSVTAGDQSIGSLNSECFQSFDFTISNNLETIYAICAGSNYYPFDIVPGLRTLSGSLSVYNIPEVEGALGYDDFEANQQGSVTFSIGSAEFTFKVRFHRVEASSSVGTIVSTVAFTGVGAQDSLDA